MAKDKYRSFLHDEPDNIHGDMVALPLMKLLTSFLKKEEPRCNNHHTLTTILKPTMKAYLLTHQSHTCPQMIITSLILNPPNLVPTLAYTHNFLVDRQTTVRRLPN